MKKILQCYFRKRVPDYWTDKHVEKMSERAYGTVMCTLIAFMVVLCCVAIYFIPMFFWYKKFVGFTSTQQIYALIGLFVIFALLMIFGLCRGGVLTFFRKRIFLKTYGTGRCITSGDFAIIKKNNPILYKNILQRDIYGYCYSASFEILKTLQKGKIVFMSVGDLPFDEDKYHKYKKTAHAVFENDGYIFDSYTGRQYKKQDFMDIFEAEEYRSFCYDDVKDLLYPKFQSKYGKAFGNWCKKKSCSQAFY